MVLSLLKSGGIKCQASGFNLWVDPGLGGRIGVPEDEGEQKKLILRTESELPVNFPVSEAVIQLPGEYEISGIKIKGFEVEGESKKNKTIYMIEIDDITVCFLGNITKVPREETLDKLEEIDILFLGVGSPYLNLRQAQALIKELEPRIVIPMGDREATSLIKEMGEKTLPQDKLVIKAKDLGEEGTKVVWLSAK